MQSPSFRNTFTVPLDEVLDMEMAKLEEWVAKAAELWKRLCAPPRRG